MVFRAVTAALLLLLALSTQEGSAGGLFPQRIVSLAPSLTEILYAVGAGDQVVGVTTFCDYPPEALKKPKIGGMVDPNLEAIVAMRPDLVLATMEGNREETVRQLERLGLRVVVVNPTGVSGILRAIETVGRVTALESRAQRVVTNLRNRLDRVARAISGRPRPRVLYLLWTEPAIVPGRDTVITDLISRAGGESVSGQEPLPYPRYSLEEVVAKAPEIVILARHDSWQVDEPLQPWRHPAISLPAFATGRVYTIDGDLINRPGPRVVDGIETLARFFHPGVLP